ncbi:spore coat protein [Anaerocolumna sp.]|uniref:spore coat protein n=1 Tax=Anaerocolumna sp. TaxID=2041569 RepID=UPI0028A5F56D|nr:spore coat protein [Anaerocolumna sp.]
MITNVTLTTKEKFLLEDQKSDEQICIQKYANYANLATDPELKNILNSNKKQEEEHLNTINQLLSGKVPSMNSNQGSSSQSNSSSSEESISGSAKSSQSKGSSGTFQASDKDLCTDLLMTEKFVSGNYDTAIFEFKDPQVRDVLNHIQKEEQKHGESIYKYMESKGMYKPK